MSILLWSSATSRMSPRLPGVQYRLVFDETTSGRLLLHGRKNEQCALQLLMNSVRQTRVE